MNKTGLLAAIAMLSITPHAPILRRGPVGPHKCPACGKSFSGRIALKQHQRSTKHAKGRQ
jgi:hypothetical protein